MSIQTLVELAGHLKLELQRFAVTSTQWQQQKMAPAGEEWRSHEYLMSAKHCSERLFKRWSIPANKRLQS